MYKRTSKFKYIWIIISSIILILFICYEIKAEKNLDGIELQVNARNSAAYEMYRKYGFTQKSINMELLD